MTKYILTLLLIFDISYSMNRSISGQLEPDRNLMFSQDIRTKSKVVSVQAYNTETLQYYATNAKLARIVSFDGGGVRGIGAASWCANFEHITGKPMADLFNFFAGTSTGGIIATALTMENPKFFKPPLSSAEYIDENANFFKPSPSDAFAGTSTGGTASTTSITKNLTLSKRSSGNAEVNANKSTRSLYSADDIVDLYINECKNIFKPRSLLGYLCVSKYKTDSAYATFDKYFSNTKLSQIRSDCDLLITYYNLTNNHPALFRSHKAKNPIFSRNEDFYLKDIIASTTAAPTYFKEFKLYSAHSKGHPEIHSNNFISAIDGGVAANDPSICALAEATSLYRNADAFLSVSMGTGNCVSEVNPRGLISWAKNISSILMQNTYVMSNQLLKKFGGNSNKPVFCSRLQFDVSEAHSAMDNKSPQNISYLRHQAQNTSSAIWKIEKISNALEITKKPERHDLIGDILFSESNVMEI